MAPGAAIGADQTGDEPQIFVRSGLAPVGIGADRYRAGMQLRHELGADVMLLDDGFQHLKLARDVDIVLIDALDPFGGGAVFPLGRLREPMEGLARADLILISRSNLAGYGGRDRAHGAAVERPRAGLPRPDRGRGLGGEPLRAAIRAGGQAVRTGRRVLRLGQSAIVPPH